VGVDEFVALFSALYMFYSSLKRIGTLSGELRKGFAFYERINQTLEYPSDIVDPIDPKTIDRIRGEILFDNVSFSYDDQPTLTNVNIKIKEGEVCALVGPSGAGKTTFANLILRFYDVDEGMLKVGGFDVRDLKLNELRENIAIVSQDPILFNMSILDNIRLGCGDASDDEFIYAAKQAFAHEFISEFPESYQTNLGENGFRLSGGKSNELRLHGLS
jgi:ATP-binding cassette, subfamily B, bacterial MsbA